MDDAYARSRMKRCGQVSAVVAIESADYELLVDSISDFAVVLLDPAGAVVTWNAGAERIHGWSKGEIVGQRFSVLYPKVEIESGRPARDLEAAHSSGRVEEEGWRVRKDGSRFWASVVIAALRTKRGSIRGFAQITRDLTDVRNTHELRHMVDSIRDYAVFMLDPDGHIVTWNTGAQRIKGYTREEIVGRHMSTFYPEPARLAKRPQTLLAAAARDGRVEDEGWRVRKDGTRFWANVIISAVRSDRGELIGYTKVTRDLTERKEKEELARMLAREEAARAAAQEAEARIRESEDRYRNLSARLDVILQGVADGITVQDQSGRIVYANDAAARACGLSNAAELIAASPESIAERFELLDEAGNPIPPEAVPAQRVLAGKEAEPMTARVRERATGREWWSVLKSSAVRDSAGRVELAVNIWHDMSPQRRQREAERYFARASDVLARSLDTERTFRALAELLVPELADWCAVHTFEGGVLELVALAHRDAEKVLLVERMQSRYPPKLDRSTGLANVLRTGRSELYSEITSDQVTAAAEDQQHAELLRRLDLRSAIMVPLRAHGRTFGAMTVIASSSGRRYDMMDLNVVEEIARRASFAIENARLYSEAQRAIQLRDEFLSVASHELRTPLTTLDLHLSGVIRAADRARLEQLGIEKVEQHVRKAYGQVQRLTTLISDLLDVSRIVGGHLALRPEPLELGALAREVCARFEDELARAGTPIALTVESDVFGTWDRNRIDQVLTNLITNAVKYGGQRPIEVKVEKSASFAKLSVRDHGIGIRKEDQERIFNRFERTDAARNFGGLGLGLWIVRQVSEAHGGRAIVESEPEKGSTFIVELPLDPPQRRDG
jgi:PAS domain S-box-containing protein